MALKRRGLISTRQDGPTLERSPSATLPARMPASVVLSITTRTSPSSKTRTLARADTFGSKPMQAMSSTVFTSALWISSGCPITATETLGEQAASAISRGECRLHYKSFSRRSQPLQTNRLWEGPQRDRKSTRLNSSHTVISYAALCLKKNKDLL